VDEAAQRSEVEGHGNIVVQVTGDGNVLNLRRDLPALWLDTFASPSFEVTEGVASDPGFTSTGKLETDLLTPYTRALTLVGRRPFLDRLHAWLDDPMAISVTAVIGGGGRGKTRVALELCREAATCGWLAGFVTRDELTRFRGQTAVASWGWPKPTLVVVDYAAAQAEALRGWLADLTRHATAWTTSGHPRLRLLLLERHGDRGSGWMARMLGTGGQSARASKLLSGDAPLTLGPLETPEDRRAVFIAAYQLASGADPPIFADLDQRLGEQSAGGEPLLLAMLGLYAARRGVVGALGKAPDTLALEIARWELERIRKIWKARGLHLIEDTPLPDHLAAVTTLRIGLTEHEAHAVIAEEAAALHQAHIAPAGATEPARAALHAALPADGKGIAPILPDFLGEAALLAAWGDGDAGLQAIRRAASAKKENVLETIMRLSRDFPNQPASRRYLSSIRQFGQEPSQLISSLVSRIRSKPIFASISYSSSELRSTDRTWEASVRATIGSRPSGRTVGTEREET
jgi:hypothetical protein